MSYYLDAHACCPLDEALKDALFERLGTASGNPSSAHTHGQRARAAVEEARSSLCDLLDIRSNDRLIFTSGATESNNHVFSSSVLDPGKKVITTSIEHPSVLNSLRARQSELDVTVLEYPKEAQDWDDRFEAALDEDVSLISCILVNNETGEIMPMDRIIPIIRERSPQALVHSDAVQAPGKIPLSFHTSGFDCLSLSGHKIGALPGIGALIVSERMPHHPMLHGGAQETRWRAGTENVAGIISFGLAAAELIKHQDAWRIQVSEQMTRVREYLTQALPGTVFLNEDLNHVPNVLSVRFPGIRSDDLVVALDLKGVSISAGSACASGKQLPSPVLLAMGYPEDIARESVRLSLFRPLTERHLDHALELIVETVDSMSGYARKQSVRDEVLI